MPRARRNDCEYIEIPIWKKSTMTVDEAVAYSGIGRIKCICSLIRRIVHLCYGLAENDLLNGNNLMNSLMRCFQSKTKGIKMQYKKIWKERQKKKAPIWEREKLTINEAALYSGIGRNKLRQLTDDSNCTFVLWIDAHRFIDRKRLDEFIDHAYSI